MKAPAVSISNNSFSAVGFNFPSENVMQLRKLDTISFFRILKKQGLVINQTDITLVIRQEKVRVGF